MRQIAGGSWQGGRITYLFLLVVIYRSGFVSKELYIAGVRW